MPISDADREPHDDFWRRFNALVEARDYEGLGDWVEQNSAYVVCRLHPAGCRGRDFAICGILAPDMDPSETPAAN